MGCISLLGLSLDELLSKEEITKEAIVANVNRQKNKRNVIILIIAIALLVAISVTAIVLAVLPSAPENDGYELVGLVGTFDRELPTMEALQQGKLFGYCFTRSDSGMTGKGDNLARLHTQYTGASLVGNENLDERQLVTVISRDLKMDYSFEMNVIIPSAQRGGELYAVYYDGKSDKYIFEHAYNISAHGEVRVGLDNRGYRWDTTINFRRVDTLTKVTLYEYGLNSVLLNTLNYNGEQSYSVSDKCMYIAVEYIFTDEDGNAYSSVDVVPSSQINPVLFYPLPTLNANGYGTTSLELCK